MCADSANEIKWWKKREKQKEWKTLHVDECVQHQMSRSEIVFLFFSIFSFKVLYEYRSISIIRWFFHQTNHCTIFVVSDSLFVIHPFNCECRFSFRLRLFFLSSFPKPEWFCACVFFSLVMFCTKKICISSSLQRSNSNEEAPCVDVDNRKRTARKWWYFFIHNVNARELEGDRKGWNCMRDHPK